MVFAVSVSVAVAVALAAVPLLTEALRQRAAVEQQALDLARSAADAVEREYRVTEGLLTGLASSQALKDKDFETFHAEAVRLQKPADTNILLADPAGNLLLNTLRPFGTPLPPTPPSGRAWAAATVARGTATASDRLFAPILGRVAVGVALPLRREGQITALLVMSMPAEAMNRVVSEVRVPKDWQMGVLDRRGAAIAGWSGGVGLRYSDVDAQPVEIFPAVAEGWLVGGERLGDDYRVAFGRSASSGWTVVVGVPRDALAGPIRQFLARLAAVAALALTAGALWALASSSRISRRIERQLAGAERRFRTTADLVPAVVFAARPDGRCEFLNAQGAALDMSDDGDPLGANWLSLAHPDDSLSAAARWHTSIASGRPFSGDMRLRAGDGAYRWHSAKARAIRDPDGKIERWVGVAVDIDDTKRAEEAMRSARQLLRSTIDALYTEIAILDHQGRVLVVNKALRRSARARARGGGGKLLGRQYAGILREWGDPEAARQLEAGLGTVVGGQRPRFRGLFRDRLRGRSYQMRVSSFGADAQRRLVVSHEDVSELDQTATELRSMTRKLMQAEENERRRIARELHDSTAQQLVAASINLDRLRRQYTAGGVGATALLVETTDLIGRTLQEIRDFSYLLHPPLLEELGLEAAVETFAKGFGRRSGLEVTVTINTQLPRTDAALETTVLRVVQEAFVNIHRHAGANRASVYLGRRGSDLVIAIEDDGRGIDLANVSPGESAHAIAGLGIAGMQARVRQLGGVLEIESTGSGSRVSAAIPLEAHAQPAVLRSDDDDAGPEAHESGRAAGGE